MSERPPTARPGATAANPAGQAATGEIRRDALLRADLGAITPVTSVQATRIELPPGRRGGRHMHPVPVVGYVVSGRIVYQLEGGPARTLSPGDAFFEPRDAVVLSFDNASDQEPATFVAYYLLGRGDEELIRMLPEE